MVRPLFWGDFLSFTLKKDKGVRLIGMPKTGGLNKPSFDTGSAPFAP